MENKNRMNSSQISTSHTEWITFVISQTNIFRRNQKYCDLLLEVNGKTHNAHRNILASWSSIIDSYLSEQSLLSSPCTVLKINFNGDDNVFSDFLDFIYTGLIDLREDNFLSLLHLACSFEILLLKGYCENFLKNNLHLGNLLSTYLLSRRYHLQYVEEVAVKFLQTNLSDIVKQPEFLSLSPGKLNAILSGSCMQQLKPEIKLFLIISWVGFDVKNRELFLVVLLQHIHWSSVAADFLVEISQTDNFFTSNESSLYLLLQTLNSSKIGLGPYKDDFPILHSLYSHLMHDVFHLSTLPVEIENFTAAEVQALCSDSYFCSSSQKQCASTQTENIHGENGACTTFSNACVRNQSNLHNTENERLQPVNISVTSIDSSVLALETNLVEHYDIDTATVEFNTTIPSGNTEDVSGPTTSLDKIDSVNIPPLDIPVHPSLSDANDTCKNKRVTTGKRCKKAKDILGSENRINGLSPGKSDDTPQRELGKSISSHAMQATSEAHTRPTCMFMPPLMVDGLPVDKNTSLTRESSLMTTEKLVPNSDDVEENWSTNNAPISVEKQETVTKNKDDNIPVTNPRVRTPPNATPEKKVTTKKSNKKANVGERKCPECDYEAHTSKRLQRHILRFHKPSNFQFKCNICDFETKWNLNFNNHMRTHFPGPEYKCDFPNCDYIGWFLQNLLRHRAKHFDDRPFGCDICPMRFRTVTNLAAHTKYHSEDRPFKCDQCEKTFRTRSTLQQHHGTHSNSRPFLCDICGFSAKYQTQLANHQRRHTGNIIHCEFKDCNFSTSRKHDMKYHVRSHLDIREFRCKTCGMDFIENGHLLRHEKSHLAVKPYKCKHCDYESSRSDKYREHVWRHHGEKTVKQTKEKTAGVTGAKMPYKPRKPRTNKGSNSKSSTNKRKSNEEQNLPCETKTEITTPVPETPVEDHSMKSETEFDKTYGYPSWKFTVNNNNGDSYIPVQTDNATLSNTQNIQQYMGQVDLHHTVLPTPDLQQQHCNNQNTSSNSTNQLQVHQSYMMDPVHKIQSPLLVSDNQDKDSSHKTHTVSPVNGFQSLAPVVQGDDTITLQRLYEMAPQYHSDHNNTVDQIYAGSHSVNVTYHGSTTDSPTYQTAHQHLQDNFQVPPTSSANSSDYNGLNAFMSLF